MFQTNVTQTGVLQIITSINANKKIVAKESIKRNQDLKEKEDREKKNNIYDIHDIIKEKKMKNNKITAK